MCTSSPEFCQQLPTQVQYGLNLRTREAGYALGTYSFARDPFYFVLVNAGSVGEKLGMRSGDRILAVGDRAFEPTDSVEDFKLLLKERAGENITLTIVRDGEEKTVVWKMPK